MGDVRFNIGLMGNGNWKMAEALTVPGRETDFIIPKGFETDLASIPRPLQVFFKPYGTYAEAAILHDLLWQLSIDHRDGVLQYNDEGDILFRGFVIPIEYLLDPVDVDGMFRRAMRIVEPETSFAVRWQFWGAVRSAAIVDGRKGEMLWYHWLQLAAVLTVAVGLAASFLALTAAIFSHIN